MPAITAASVPGMAKRDPVRLVQSSADGYPIGTFQQQQQRDEALAQASLSSSSATTASLHFEADGDTTRQSSPISNWRVFFIIFVSSSSLRCTYKMVEDVVGERYKGGYDFIKLLFDFQNKCNRGYVFINLTDPAPAMPFYQAFKRMQWVETVEKMQQFLMLRYREKLHSRPTSMVKLED